MHPGWRLTRYTQLIEDPAELVAPWELVRLLGNVGKPGIIFLRAPKDPIMRELDPGAWKVLQFAPFDGQPIDCFQSTTLHLALTDWSLPMTNSTSFGQRDVEAFICEAVISVRDAGVWVADVCGSLPIEGEDCDKILPRPSNCPHSKHLKPSEQTMSLETWNEILEGHGGHTVVRSHGNWLGRRAVTFVLLQHCKEKSVVVCPKDMCWGCVRQDLPKGDIVWVY